MNEREPADQEEIHSKVLRAGRRTYFFDVRSTKAGDYYLTITESKKFTHDDGSFHYKKHKIYLYKEDFEPFRESVDEMMDFILNEKGAEVISEKHQTDFRKEDEGTEFVETVKSGEPKAKDNFTDLDFDDI